VIDLSTVSGLPLSLDESDGSLRFGPGLTQPEPDVRRLSDAREVLAEAEAAGPEDLYYMYRDVCREQDRELLEARGLRYDVTVLRPGLLGGEYVKTVGHYHPTPPGADDAPGDPEDTATGGAMGSGDADPTPPRGTTYPELYQVLAGRALYLLQRPGVRPDAPLDVVAVPARPGEAVLVPPGYGHITVNIGRGFLAMANWVERTFASVYEPLRVVRGAAYYVVAEGDIGRGEAGPRFQPNPSYRRYPEVRELRPMELPDLGIHLGRPMYLTCMARPETYHYLVRPEGWAGRLDWTRNAVPHGAP